MDNNPNSTLVGQQSDLNGILLAYALLLVWSLVCILCWLCSFRGIPLPPQFVIDKKKHRHHLIKVTTREEEEEEEGGGGRGQEGLTAVV